MSDISHLRTSEPFDKDAYLLAAEKVASYLYQIDGNVTEAQTIAIGQLRQMVNEEFVAKGKQVSSQLIYDMLKEVL